MKLGESTMGAPNGGLSLPEARTVVFRRGGAAAVGDVGAFDLTNSDAAVSNNRLGDAASGLRNVRVPVAGDQYHGVPCVFTKVCPDNGETEVITAGPVQAKVVKASGSVAIGDPLYIAASGGTLTADSPGAGAKVVAKANQAIATPATATLADVLFYDFGVADS